MQNFKIDMYSKSSKLNTFHAQTNDNTQKDDTIDLFCQNRIYQKEQEYQEDFSGDRHSFTFNPHNSHKNSHKTSHTNVKIVRYHIEKYVLSLSGIHPDNNKYLCNEPIYEVYSNHVDKKPIYIGGLRLNHEGELEPSPPPNNYGVLIAHGTGFDVNEYHSSLSQLTQQIYTNYDTKKHVKFIDGLGSEIKNNRFDIISGICGLIGGYGIHKRVQTGQEFINNHDFTIVIGYSRGAIASSFMTHDDTVTNKSNNKSNCTHNTKENIHLVLLDPVAGSGFNLWQHINNIYDKNQSNFTKHFINESRVRSGTIIYTKEKDPLFKPVIYEIKNKEKIKIFTTNTNHMTIDNIANIGIIHGMRSLIGLDKFTAERELFIGKVIKSILEKILIAYGFGIVHPSCFPLQTEKNFIKSDELHNKQKNIINKPVMLPIGSNKRQTLQEGIPSLEEFMLSV